MNSKETSHQPGVGNGPHHPLKWSGLQARMTMSYVWATVVLVLLLEILALVVLAFTVSSFVAPYVYTLTARQAAEQYAYAAALQAKGPILNRDATFLDGQPGSLVLPEKQAVQDDTRVPYITTLYPDTHPIAFALLVASDDQVVASSYPRLYPINKPVSVLLPARVSLIANTLAGAPASGRGMTTAGSILYAAQTVWSRDEQPIGAVYVQIPGPPSLQNVLEIWQPVVSILLVSGLLLFAITVPIGGLFGLLTTRGMVRRIRKLATATTQFADGHYIQHVPVTRQDEIGQLEQQFNRMAQQLAASMTQQQTLAEQNARLAERARISRELHDAISQDLFSLRMLGGGLRTAIAKGSNLQPFVETLEEAADRMTREMRALLLELRPSQLEQFGLATALEELAAAYHARLGIIVTTTLDPVPLDEKTEHALLRIAQEALTNAARHASASAITLRLQSLQDTIEFEITDNGKGFDPTENGTHHGLGLHLMQERVQELHGMLSLQTTPGQGTRITISLPQENRYD